MYIELHPSFRMIHLGLYEKLACHLGGSIADNSMNGSPCMTTRGGPTL